MNLDCALCNAKVIAHLFVQLPTDQVCEYFSLARSDVTDPESGSSPSVPTLALSRFNVMRVGLMRWIRYDCRGSSRESYSSLGRRAVLLLQMSSAF